MAPIHVLSEETINKIAAGEVVENPASVVKELVENGVDAGSTKIEVEIRGGGLQLIRISDDGSGMSPEDALLCLQRHTTSKIESADDLFHLSTMGFRGEALASIAAISKMTLTTARENEEGTRIEIEGGKIVEVAPHCRSRGTAIEVRALFYNVPARKKFQKSATYCAADVTRTMTLLCLAHQDIGFSYKKQEEEVFSVEPQLKEREKKVLGSAFCEGSFRVESQGIKGVLGNPLQSRSNRSGQYLFINRRPILSPLIGLAVKDGYGTRIAENRFPIFILHLTINPQEIDINVHPQKREVRFQDENKVKQLVRESVSAAFHQPREAVSISTTPLPFNFSYPPFLFKEEAPQEKEIAFPFDTFKILKIQGIYCFIEDQAELLLVDLLSLREMVLFEKITTKKIDTQGLLFPEIFEVSLGEAEKLEAAIPLFEEVGFEIRSIGARRFMIEAIPPFLEEGQLGSLILNLLETDDLEDHLASLLSKTSRRFKQSFMLQEAQALYSELKKNSSLSLSVKGKATVVKLTVEELSKFF